MIKEKTMKDDIIVEDVVWYNVEEKNGLRMTMVFVYLRFKRRKGRLILFRLSLRL